ncbi:hypothetical protein QZH41_000587 [Actinostola sp. cb2023]|nr:hypothetical protein QZH41_000587 [Actinostola sp. cb2023]
MKLNLIAAVFLLFAVYLVSGEEAAAEVEEDNDKRAKWIVDLLSHYSCRWLRLRGYCKYSLIRRLCPAYCRCKNILSAVSCFRLAKKGFCKRNGLVRTYCRLTCNTCINAANLPNVAEEPVKEKAAEVEEDNDKRAKWIMDLLSHYSCRWLRLRGYCKFPLIRKLCPATCRCKNILSNVSCYKLFKKGFCKRNGLVRTYCRLTCNTCIRRWIPVLIVKTAEEKRDHLCPVRIVGPSVPGKQSGPSVPSEDCGTICALSDCMGPSVPREQSGPSVPSEDCGTIYSRLKMADDINNETETNIVQTHSPPGTSPDTGFQATLAQINANMGDMATLLQRLVGNLPDEGHRPNTKRTRPSRDTISYSDTEEERGKKRGKHHDDDDRPSLTTSEDLENDVANLMDTTDTTETPDSEAFLTLETILDDNEATGGKLNQKLADIAIKRWGAKLGPGPATYLQQAVQKGKQEPMHSRNPQ